MAGSGGMGYIPRESPIHRLTGTTKLLMAVLASVASMITYDTRFLCAMIIGAMLVFAVSKIRFREIRLVLGFIAVLMVINSIAIYLFSPEEGVRIYGTRTELFHIIGRYSVTVEQLFYMLNVVLKYFSVLPMALIFITATNPSEFASSLNRIGVSYKIAYSVALTLRYIPDIRRDYTDISQAQQARGIDMSRKTPLFQRVKNVTAVLLPLIFSSLSRVEVISNAMELRGFGRHKKRSWYMSRSFRAADFVAVAVCGLLVLVSLALNVVNGGRFFNPFV